MDQPSKAEEAQHEPNTSKFDTGSPIPSAPHHRSGHSGAHHHKRSSHGESHNFREFSDFSHSSHHHSRAYNHPSITTGFSHGTVPHHSNREDHFYEHHPSGKMHHSGVHHHDGSQQSESPYYSKHHHGGPHQPGDTLTRFSSSESYHHGGSHHPNVSGHGHGQHGGHHRRSNPYQEDSHTVAFYHGHRQSHHYGRPHYSDTHHHRRHPQYGESLTLHSPEESYQPGASQPHGHRRSRSGDPHYRKDYHHGEHHYRKDYHHGEHHYREHHRSTSQVSLPYKSQSVLGASQAHPGAKGSAPTMTPSYFTFRSRMSSKVHPRETSKESNTWTEDEQHQKRKSRIQRAHKKLHSGNVFQRLWEKLNSLIWGFRRMIWKLTQTLAFETFIFFVVCLNTAMLVAQTFTELEIRGEWYFMVLDWIFLCIYVVEALLKTIALGLEYFYDPWNNLDFFIMVMAVLDFVLVQVHSLSYSFYNHSLFLILKVFKSMRALRAIRVLRRLSILTKLHEVTGTLSGSLPSIMAILTLMFTCIFLFSVVLRALFRKSDPLRFQNIFTTLFTLFTMLTLDDWSLIYIDSRAKGAWYIIPILMIYIIIQYFIFLNLVIAVLVDNFQMALLKGLEKTKLEKAARAHEKLLEDSLTELNRADPEAVMSESALQMQFIERKFGTMTERQRELHFQFLQLVASVEQHQQKFRSQASVIDEVVDTAFEAGEEDYGK